MAYDETLADRIRTVLKTRKGFTEKKMFGGIAFMLRGKMCLGIVKSDLMARVGEEEARKALKKPGVRPMDFTGRPMKGYLFVGPEAIKTEAALKRWIDLCAKFNAQIR